MVDFLGGFGAAAHGALVTIFFAEKITPIFTTFTGVPGQIIAQSSTL
ncbi:MAG: hypothetical protein WC846_03190 [Candidatus Gracilibacteria bacterium]|jgi:hypothetical protein